MRSGERVTVTLTGGAPWGFRLQGGGSFPLEVAKIRKRSTAHEADLREGDLVLSINGFQTSGKSHQSAMDIVDMAGDKLEFEVSRSSTGQGASQPVDPQRQPRIIPMVSEPENAGPGLVSSARAKFTSSDGNMRTDINTDEYVMKVPGGKKITKTVTEHRVTRFPPSVSPVPGISPGTSQNNLNSFQRTESPASGSSPYGSQQNLQPGEHVSRSSNRSPLIWKPQSLSPADNRANIPQSHSQPTSLSEPKAPLVWQPKSLSPSPVAPAGSHRTESPKTKKKPDTSGKENDDPVMLSEQAKWEARYGPVNVPTFSLDNFGSNTWGGRSRKKEYIPKKIEDPRYPMFDVPRVNWHAPMPVEPQPELYTYSAPQKVPPPVPPKPSFNAPSPIPFHPDEQTVAGVGSHFPGMIRPPVQPNVKPAPPPPPMPPAPGPQTYNGLPKPKGFRPEQFSTPGRDEPDHHRPDHLPVFGPKVMFTPEEDSGLPLSPDRSDHLSDISSLARTDTEKTEEDTDEHCETPGKVFSDSAFYDDSTHRYPTIDEQMSMCKRIAESLTSAANTRARGARMFARRKRKADKWVHDQNPEYYGFKLDSSSTGDVADLQDLDSELYYDEGGIKPLFTFRIPKIAGQFTPGQKMSLSKEEFEKLRFVAPRVDHHAVSPNVCFSIAADLHKGGKNRGARLFQKRQQRVEKFVIDETNVPKPHGGTRLNNIIHSPQSNAKPTPWNAAAHGDVQAAFDRNPRTVMSQPVHYPRHDLTAEQKPSLIQGDNYNRKIKGWQAGPAHAQQSFYRDEEYKPLENEETKEEGDHTQQWNTQARQRSPSPVDHADGDPHKIPFGDYNRRIKAWQGGADQPRPQPAQQPQPQPSYNYSAQPNYNSLPRGFTYSRQPQGMGVCDL